MSKPSSSPSASVNSAAIVSLIAPRREALSMVSDPATTLGAPPLVACITACNESREELQFCLDTFHGKRPVDLNFDAIYVILDGCPDEDMQGDNNTFQALASVMDLQADLYGDKVPPGGAVASISEGGCRVYVGKVGSISARLYVKGRGDFQRSKRRSIIAFYDVLGERIASGKSEEPLAVLHMDADTGSSEPGRDNSTTSFGLENVARLLRIMRDDENLGALATQVRVLHRTKNALGLMQSFDCNATYVGINGGTGLVGRSTACLGMTVMYRYRTLHVSSVKGILSPMAAFSRTADRNIVDHVNLDMNEDQGMTTFIMRAGYDTKTSLITRFYTFAPETIAELLGQRRRWQVGFLVGLPYQMVGSPSPHLQLSRARWLAALSLTNVYANVLLMPGTLGFGLAFMFDQAYVGVAHLLRGLSSDTAGCDGQHLGIESTDVTDPSDHGGTVDCAGGVMTDEQDGSFTRQAVFAACTWAFWLSFVASTIGRAPKAVRIRCQVFFVTASMVTVAVILTAALVSHAGQAFLGVLVGCNAVVGLLLTYDIREWPHRLQEVLFYCVFLCAIKPMITMYAVANVDSALWGTRSVGDVKNTSDDNASSTTSASETDSNTDNDSDEGIMMRTLAYSRGHRDKTRVTSAATAAAIADGVDEEEAVPLKHDDKEDLAIHDEDNSPQPSKTHRGLGGKGGGQGREVRKTSPAGPLSLRAWKFILLVPWVLLNVGATAMYVRWSLPTLAALGFFGNVTGQTLFVVAAWVEMRRQRRTVLRPPSPYVAADTPSGGTASPRNIPV